MQWIKEPKIKKIKEPESTKCYMLSKMHKIDNSWRPAVSSIGCLSTNISKIVNYRLQPILKYTFLRARFK